MSLFSGMPRPLESSNAVPPLKEVLHFDKHQACCSNPAMGDLFPDLLLLEKNVLNRGRVLGAYLAASGLGIQERRVVEDPQAWQACIESPNFRSCYDLSLAKLHLQEALRRI
jgi:hypothetical protein